MDRAPGGFPGTERPTPLAVAAVVVVGNGGKLSLQAITDLTDGGGVLRDAQCVPHLAVHLDLVAWRPTTVK